MKIHRVLGPPGTGKTHRLLELVEQELDRGIDAEQIAYVTFTRKGAQEAVTRAVDKFDIERNRFEYFRTIHSLAYRLLGMRDGDVMQFNDYREFGSQIGVKFNFNVDADEAMSGSEEGDKLRALEELARNTMRDYRQTWDDEQIDLEWERFDMYCRELRRFKADTQKFDFTDMLVNLLDSGIVIEELKTAFIDEAQDLSVLQWEVMLQTFGMAKQLYVAGDDDQAIYRWNGADAKRLGAIEFDSEEKLTQSYRCSRAVRDLAVGIVGRIDDRVEKTWEPRDADGSFDRLISEDELEIDESQSWYLLTRNRTGFKRWEDLLHELALPYLLRDKPYAKPEELAAIRAWESYRKGGDARDHDLTLAREMISGKFKGDVRDWDAPKDKVWYDAMVRLNARRRRFYREALRRERNLDVLPKIRVDTIHGVKGGEADQVALLTDVGYLSWLSMQESSDDEHRVFYVGVTRARHGLHLIEPATEMHYDI